jgi:hypothetical protein
MIALPQIELAKLAANGMKYLAMLLGVALIGGSLWYGGVRHERSNTKAELANVLERELVVAEKEKAILSKEAEAAGRRLSALLSRLENVGEDLNEAIQTAGDRPECALTPSELELFKRLGGKAGLPANVP